MGGSKCLAITLLASLTACGGTIESTQTSDATEAPTATIRITPLQATATTTNSAGTADFPADPDTVSEPAVATENADPLITPRTGPPPPRRITAAFTGDILPHSPLWRQAERNGVDGALDFRPMFAETRDQIAAADLAVCHLETPIALAGADYTTHPLYGVPAEIVDAIAWSGYDRCSTASNHTLDKGTAGIDRTIQVMEQAGLAQSGMARSAAEIEPQTFVVEGIVLSHLSYTYSYNGIRAPKDQPWRSALIDSDRIIADAQKARRLGAEVVIVSMHWGTETVSTPNRQQREVSEAVTASGLVDLIVGHHAHVLQPIEQVNGTWVAFGLSNVLSNLPGGGSFPRSSQDAAILEVTIEVDHHDRVTVSRPTVTPTWVDLKNGWVIRDVFARLADNRLGDGIRPALEKSSDRTASVLGPFLAP